MRIQTWIEQYLGNGFDGSDIYLIEGNRPWVRPGNMALHQVEDGPLPGRADIEDLMKGRPNEKALRADLAEKGSADFGVTIGHWRMRANVSYQSGGREVRAVCRVLKDSVPDLDSLGLPTDLLQSFVLRRSGIILVTGITGSGKSTTMASMLMERAKRSDHIVALEDPIEYPLTTIARGPGFAADVQQVEIGTDARSYADALRAALRQDPDVIQVGEINDAETADLAVKAAETGHLVLATLHTRSAHLSVENLIDKFPSDSHKSLRTNLSEYLIAVVSQVLLPTTNGSRGLAYEIMINSDSIRNHIRDGRIQQIPNEIRQGASAGMTTLNRTLIRMTRDGIIDRDVALENTYDREGLERNKE